MARTLRRNPHPVDEVAPVYEHELEALGRKATVRTFLPVFAKRRALER